MTKTKNGRLTGGTVTWLPVVPAVLGLSLVLTGCPTIAIDNGNNDGNGLGLLLLSGQVWTMEEGFNRDTETWESVTAKFTENREVFSDFGGTGWITGGLLDFRGGTPGDNDLADMEEALRAFSGWETGDIPNVTVSGSADARAVWLTTLETAAGTISRRAVTLSANGRTDEWVNYIFVDRNVTVTGELRTHTDRWEWDGDTFGVTTRHEAFTLPLRAGWNTVHFALSAQSAGNIAANTWGVSHGDPPHLKWVIF